MKNPAPGKKNKGAIMILMAVGLMMLLGFAALVIDIGYALATKAQLQNVADSGAIAGTHELARIYNAQGSSFDYTQYTLTGDDESRVLSRVNDFTLQNTAAGVEISVGPSDVTYGVWDGDAQKFTPGSTGVNALTVTARRDDTANGALATTLASMFGVPKYAVKADAAVNLLSGLGSLPPGMGDVPFGIASAWFDAKDSPCGTDNFIRFYPTGTTAGCAGWHVFDQSPANASTLRSIIDGLRDDTYISPEAVAGDTSYNFIGGTVTAGFHEFVKLFNESKGDDGTWVVHVPVYEQADCSNPSGRIKIIGFATARIVNVVTAPSKRIDARVECDIVNWGRGDGPTGFGTSVQVTRLID